MVGTYGTTTGTGTVCYSLRTYVGSSVSDLGYLSQIRLFFYPRSNTEKEQGKKFVVLPVLVDIYLIFLTGTKKI
jgi:hypothetical protein